MTEAEHPQSEENHNDVDILGQIADLMSEIDSKQADLDANVLDQANAAVEGKVNSAEVADILEDKLMVVFEGVMDRLKEISSVREAARAEKLAAIDAGDQTTADSIVTKTNEDEWSEAKRISNSIINYMNQKAAMPAPEREHGMRVLLQDIQQFFEMRKGK